MAAGTGTSRYAGGVDYRQIAYLAAQKYGVDPGIFTAQIRQESGFNPNARSPAGAMGIAQIMPATARGWGVNPRDPVASLDAAAKNMSRYLRSYGGDYRRALAAYNAGPGAVAKYGGVPPYAETQNYVRRILGSATQGPQTAPGAPAGPYQQMGGQQVLPQAVSVNLPAPPSVPRVANQRLEERLNTSQGIAVPVFARRLMIQPPAVEAGGGVESIPPIAAPLAGDGSYKWAEDIGRRFGLSLASTYRSPAKNAAVGGSKTSAHMRHGAATDFAGTPAQMRKLAEWAIKSGQFREVFYDPVGQWDNGRLSRRGIGGHSDHVHITR